MRRLFADPEFYEKSERHGKENRLTNDELVRLEMKFLAVTGQLDNLHDFVTERKEDLLSLFDIIEKKKAAGERFEESEATRLFTQLMRVIALAHQHGGAMAPATRMEFLIFLKWENVDRSGC